MNNQDVFNKVWERAKDKRRSMSTFQGCFYRDQRDLESKLPPCFIGVCVSDELVEECSNSGAIVPNMLQFPKWNEQFKECDIGFLRQTQLIHNKFEIHRWESALREAAVDYKLTIPGESL